MRVLILLLSFCGLLFLFSLPCPGQAGLTPGALNAGKATQIRTVGEAEALLMQAKRIEESDPAFSEMLARSVRLFALKTDNPILRIRAQFQLALLLINSTRYAEALQVALQVKELAENLNATRELGGYYEILGKIQISTGDYSESLKNLYQALKYFEKLRDPNGRGNVLNAIGVVFFRQGDLDKAMNYYTKAAAIAILNRDTLLMGRVWNNMGGVLLTRKNIPEAMSKFRESLNLQLATGMNLKQGIILMNLGNLYRQTGHFDQSIESLMKALSLFEKYDNFLHQAICCINISIFYEKTGDDLKWLSYLRKAAEIGDNYGFKGVQFDVAEGLQDYFEKHGNFDSAYRYAVLKADVRQRIDNEKSASRLSVAEIQYQFDKRNADQELRQQRQTVVIVFVVMALVSSIIIAWLIISSQRQKAKVVALEKKGLSDELEFKNRELALQVMNLMKRNEFIIDTSHRLMNIDANQPPAEIKEEVIKIAKSLKDQTDKEIWEEFELRFKQVHSGFYERLLARFPGLTPNELKMCGLLRLNLTTKEISELTGQQRAAIEMARFRLRKHLGLQAPQVNLVNFLGKI